MTQNAARDCPTSIVLPDTEHVDTRPNRLKLLPNEILLQIAGELRGTKYISSLARVDKYTNAVANEAMAKTLVFHESQIKKVIEWLMKHTELIKSVTAIEVIGPARVTYPSQFWSRILSFDAEVETALFAAILVHTKASTIWNWMKTYGKHHGSYMYISQRDALDIICMLCPNIKAATIQLQVVRPFDGLLPMHGPVPSSSSLPMVNPAVSTASPFSGSALSTFGEKLESLTIAQYREWAGPVQRELLLTDVHIRTRPIGRFPITLCGFKRLRHLDVPMDILGFPHSILFQAPDGVDKPTWRTFEVQTTENGKDTKALTFPVKILPSTLETMQIRACTNDTFILLQIISLLPPHESRFKHIDLYFESNTSDFIHRCQVADCVPTDYIGKISALRTLGNRHINVSFFSGKGAKPVDMCWELTRMASLPPTEVIVMSSALRQFSRLNEIAVERRKSSRVEHRLFMKHAPAHFDLFNSSTFLVSKWRRTAFFTGTKICQQPSQPQLLALRFAIFDSTPEKRTTRNVHPLPKRRPLGFFDLEDFNFTFRHAKSFPTTEASMKLSWDTLASRTSSLLSLVKSGLKRFARPALEQSKNRSKRVVKRQKVCESARRTEFAQVCPTLNASMDQDASIAPDCVFVKEDWEAVQWARHF